MHALKTKTQYNKLMALKRTPAKAFDVLIAPDRFGKYAVYDNDYMLNRAQRRFAVKRAATLKKRGLI